MGLTNRITVLVATLLLASCATTQYMVNTNFHAHLEKGMTKQEFLDGWYGETIKILGGNVNLSSRYFTIGNDDWEVWIFGVYEHSSVRRGAARIDHKEYVAFKNGKIEEWGVGSLPVSLKGDPSLIHVESGG